MALYGQSPHDTSTWGNLWTGSPDRCCVGNGLWTDTALCSVRSTPKAPYYWVGAVLCYTLLPALGKWLYGLSRVRCREKQGVMAGPFLWRLGSHPHTRISFLCGPRYRGNEVLLLSLLAVSMPSFVHGPGWPFLCSVFVTQWGPGHLGVLCLLRQWGRILPLLF